MPFGDAALALPGLSRERRAGWAGPPKPEQTAIKRARSADRPRDRVRANGELPLMWRAP